MDGLVIEVAGSSPARVDWFTLRTADGQQLHFALGPIALDDGAFPPNHLREHQALATPVRVTYRPDGDRLVAVRLEDAPPS